MISFLIWVVLGFLAGFVAKALMPGPDSGGFIVTTLLGIVGAVIGGIVGRALGFGVATSFDNIGSSLPTFLFAVIGAVIVLAIYRLATGRRLSA